MSGCNCENPSAKYYGPHDPDCDSLPVGRATIEFRGNVQRIGVPYDGGTRVCVPEEAYNALAVENERLRAELGEAKDTTDRLRPTNDKARFLGP